MEANDSMMKLTEKVKFSKPQFEEKFFKKSQVHFITFCLKQF